MEPDIANEDLNPAPAPLRYEAADWDEEDLGLDWDESEAQRITEELTGGRGDD